MICTAGCTILWKPKLLSQQEPKADCQPSPPPPCLPWWGWIFVKKLHAGSWKASTMIQKHISSKKLWNQSSQVLPWCATRYFSESDAWLYMKHFIYSITNFSAQDNQSLLTLCSEKGWCPSKFSEIRQDINGGTWLTKSGIISETLCCPTRPPAAALAGCRLRDPVPSLPGLWGFKMARDLCLSDRSRVQISYR